MNGSYCVLLSKAHCMRPALHSCWRLTGPCGYPIVDATPLHAQPLHPHALQGLYEVAVGFFSLRKPTIKVLVNSEPVLTITSPPVRIPPCL